MSMTTEERDGYMIVRRKRDRAAICAATLQPGGRLAGLEFCEPRFQKSNSTRLAALRAIERDGYRL